MNVENTQLPEGGPLDGRVRLDAKRAQFEKTMRCWCPDHWTFEDDGCGGYHAHATELAWIAWQGATGAEREQWRGPVESLGTLRVFLLGWKGSEPCKRNGMESEVQCWIDGISELYRLHAIDA